MKWNKINALNMRTLSRSQQGAPERCRCLCSTSVTVNKMVASWGLVDDFDDEVVTTSSRLRLLDVDLQLCNAAFGLTRWARWDQMGPGTGHGGHGPWKRWPNICEFAKRSNHLAQNRIGTTPISILCLFCCCFLPLTIKWIYVNLNLVNIFAWTRSNHKQENVWTHVHM